MGYWRGKEQNTEERDLPPLTGIVPLSPEFFVYIEVNREQHSTSILLDGMEKPSQFNVFWHILVFFKFYHQSWFQDRTVHTRSFLLHYHSEVLKNRQCHTMLVFHLKHLINLNQIRAQPCMFQVKYIPCNCT